uniref:Anaphylatoxin-like domain-containing protein n=1 Tax=Neolamprologus brichardi TaxID=32507 RepID=A0A3Q4G3W5_NEOBR
CWVFFLWLYNSNSLLSCSTIVSKVMSAPNLLRVGSEENIFVEIQDNAGEENVNVRIIVRNFPRQDRTLASTTVTLTKENKFQGIGKIMVSITKSRISETSLLPYKNYQPGTDTSVVVDIVNPDGIILESKLVLVVSGIYDGSYFLPEIVSTGTWKVVSKFNTNLKQTFEAEFEVKEYVLPSFEVKLTSVPFFYVDSDELTINIKATYLFGKKVVGTAFVVFGVIVGNTKNGIPSSLQRVECCLQKGHLLIGRFLNPDNTPAKNIPVVVNPGEMKENTADNGMAKLSINTVANSKNIIITNISPERQRSANMIVTPHTSTNYIHIGLETAEVKLGQNLKFSLNLNRNEEYDITYLILSRGQLVKHYRFRAEVVVDNGRNNLHINNHKTDLTIHSTYDTGCTPGGGKDSMNVFYDAGLLFVASTTSGTPHRTDLKCPATSRRKRSTTLIDLRTSLISKYQDKEQIECCLDGMQDVPVPYTCERRCKYIVGGPGCAEAFLHCCKEMEKVHVDRKEEALKLARSEWDDEYIDSYDISVRTSFPESWLWINFTLPNCTQNITNCRTTFEKNNIPLPDSITSWHFTGISMSRTHGICVNDDLEILVQKTFFIDLRLPYSAVRGEQLEIKAILHNYENDPVRVRVDLKEETNLCSAAHKRGKYRQEVTVGRETTRAVTFTIIPMKEGLFPIEIKAAVRDGGSDGIRKMLRVVNPLTSYLSLRLDGKQVEIIKSAIPETDMVPDTAASTQIFLSGREQMSTLLENAISGKSMGTLIRQPGGCGEQNMAGMTLPVIATMYLDKTNQWEFVGFEKRNEALQHITTGYATELTFRKQDGSFAVFPHQDGSTWLTAYVAKVFAMANYLIGVNKNVICDAIKFLILNTQQPDGMFKEVGYVYSQSMRVKRSVRNRFRCLHDSLLPDCYAGVSRNLQVLSCNRLIVTIQTFFPLLRDMSSDLVAYVPLLKAYEEATPIVRWLGQYQQGDGGYGSTQATIMVYQASSEYWINAKEPEYNVDVDILLPGRKTTDKYSFSEANRFTTRTSKVIPLPVESQSGSGSGQLIMSLYYARPKVLEKDCELFNLSVQIVPEKLDEDEKIYKLTIEVLFKEERNASMSIIDVGLPTGFTFDKNDLDALSKSHSKIISRYESNTDLSERGSLIIYLNKVRSVQPEIIPFRIHSTMEASFLQPTAVSVYEYNNSESLKSENITNVSFQKHDENFMSSLVNLPWTNAVFPENCSFQRKNEVSNEDRITKACEVAHDGSIDFDPMFLVFSSHFALLRYQYVLAERTWIEYWPTTAECQTSEYRSTCVGIEDLVQVYKIHGCPKK